MAASTSPLLMRILAASVSVSNRAATIIRDIMKKGELGIVEKVSILMNAVACEFWHYHATPCCTGSTPFYVRSRMCVM